MKRTGKVHSQSRSDIRDSTITTGKKEATGLVLLKATSVPIQTY